MASGGISIPVKADAVAAVRDLQTLGRAAQRVGKDVIGAFQNNRPLQEWNRLLERSERNLQRNTQRLREQHAQMVALVQQQQQLAALQNPSHAQQARALRLPAMIALRNARIAGIQGQLQQAQAQQANVQAGKPNPLGVVGGLVAGGILGGASALAAAAFYRGLNTDASDQMMLADLLPRTRMGNLRGADTQSMVKEMRRADTYGYSGTQAISTAATMSTVGGDFGRGLEPDTGAALSLARLFGLNPEAEGQLLSQAGKAGAFDAGQANRFARMLAAEIGRTGLSPRAAEVQDATLRLINQQMTSMPRADVSSALSLQSSVAKGGPSWQGAFGADLLGRMQSSVTGATDDASLAFIQATARDKFGITRLMGRNGLQQFKEKGILAAPQYFAGYIQEKLDLTHGDIDQTIFDLARFSGIPATKWQELEDHIGLKNITPEHMAGLRGRLQQEGIHFNLGAAAMSTMGLTGNKLRRGQAGFDNGAASSLEAVLKKKADLSNWTMNKLGIFGDYMDRSFSPRAEAERAAKSHPGPPLPPPGRFSRHGLHGTPAEGLPPVDPTDPSSGLGLQGRGKQGASLHLDHHITVSFNSPLAPQIHHQFVAAVNEAMREIHEGHMHTRPHHRRDV